MASDRFTITVPEEIAKRVRKRAREERKPVSQVIADDLRTAERERIRQRMIEGYKAMAEENERLAEEWFEISAETWPDEDWSDLLDDETRRDLPRKLPTGSSRRAARSKARTSHTK
jgi:hypothetical protein